MNFELICELIKRDFPQKAIDLSSSLELLQETINDTMNAIGEKIIEAVHNRDFTTKQKFDQLALSLHEYEQQIIQTAAKLELEDVELDSTDVEDSDEEKDKRDIPNYGAYLVDHNVVHTLYENFEHVRPFGFKLQTNELIQVRTWKDMLIKTCELLYNINQETFMKFEQNPTLNGKKNKYISQTATGMRKPQLIADHIYVETNMSANHIRNLLIRMLKEYRFKINDFQVYFRADYTEINK